MQQHRYYPYSIQLSCYITLMMDLLNGLQNIIRCTTPPCLTPLDSAKLSDFTPFQLTTALFIKYRILPCNRRSQAIFDPSLLAKKKSEISIYLNKWPTLPCRPSPTLASAPPKLTSSLQTYLTLPFCTHTHVRSSTVIFVTLK